MKFVTFKFQSSICYVLLGMHDENNLTKILKSFLYFAGNEYKGMVYPCISRDAT